MHDNTVANILKTLTPEELVEVVVTPCYRTMIQKISEILARRKK